MRQKKNTFTKKDLTRETLIEFSLLYIMVFFGGAIQNKIENISKL